jgi:hypothetical protein
MREEGEVMQPGHNPTPWQILHELLTRHPEAASLQAEACHCRALSICSAARVARRLAAVQAARLAYEQLRHRLDPRRRRPIHFGVGSLLAAVLGMGLTVLDGLELGAFLPGVSSVVPTLAATAVWLTLAWLAALPGREHRWTMVAPAVGGAVLLALLLAALHDISLRPGQRTVWEHIHGSMVLGILFGIFLLVLAAGAAVVIARMEPASLSVARYRWHRTRASYDQAAGVELADAEAESVAREAWLGLVRTYASEAAAGDQHLVEQTVDLAEALLEHGRPGLPPPL